MRDQTDLFGGALDPGESRPSSGRSAGAPRASRRGGDVVLPEGFRYRAELLTAEEEAELVARLSALPFREFEFHGYTGKRRVVSYGWKYDFEARVLRKGGDVPEFLGRVREAAAAFAGLQPTGLQQVLVTEYGPGAAIGWHKDKAVFGEVVGLSLLSACTFRLRRRVAGGAGGASGWERVNVIAEPRSAYLLSGPARTEWEHSIPPAEAPRYSVTFRTVQLLGRNK
jgi:alkylated DNA repair dioxygenase AlkB